MEAQLGTSSSILCSGRRTVTVSERVPHPRAWSLLWHPRHTGVSGRQNHDSFVANLRAHRASSTLYNAGGEDVTVWLRQEQWRIGYLLLWSVYTHKWCIGLVFRRAISSDAAGRRFTARPFHRFQQRNVWTNLVTSNLVSLAPSCGVDRGLRA